MEKVITFGEIMLRLATKDYMTINQAHEFNANYGGGEANVAVALSHMGHKTHFVSKVPPNQLGDGAVKHLMGHGVNTDYIVRGSSTLGIYFLETGFGGRPSKVIYNRKHSAITRITSDEFDLDGIFTDATWFHVSGISLGLGENVLNFCIECLKCAKKHNVKVSFDFNYRTKIWSIEEAIPVYRSIMQYIDVCFGSFYDLNTIVGIDLDEEFNEKSMHDKRANVFEKLSKIYDIDYFFGTDRIVYSATKNSLSGFYYSKTNRDLTDSIKFNIHDRIGGGDAFASGVIHGLLLDYQNPEYAVRYGLNTSVLKHTIYGDACVLSCDDIESFMTSSGVAEVQR